MTVDDAHLTQAHEFDVEPIVIGGRLSHRQYFQQTFRHRDFLIRYPISVLRAKNREALLGIAWEVINPLLLVGTWWIIRGVVFPRSGGDNYLAFLIVGIFTYQYMQRFVVTAANAVDRSQNLMLSFNFPALVGPLQHTVSTFVSNIPNVVVMLLFVWTTGVTPAGWWLLVPILVIGQTAFGLGGALLLARFSVGNVDLKNALPFVFRLLFYASGVIFPLEDRIRGKAIAWLFDLNPFYAITSTARAVVMDTPLHLATVLSAAGWVIILPLVGYVVFRTGDHRYVD